jgi:DNA polymerase-3 subunit epsilon
VVAAVTGFPLDAFAVLDTETNSKDPEQARLLEICLGLVVPGRDTDLRTTVVDPGEGVIVPAEATAVNGLTIERCRAEGKPAAEVLDTWIGDIALAARSELPLVIQNAPYDLTVLDRDARRHDLPTLHDRLGDTPLVVLDPLVLDKRCIKYRKRVSAEQGARCLKTLCQVYGVPWDDQRAHGAEYDAMQAGRVVWRMGQWVRLSYRELTAKQVGPFDPPRPMHRNDARMFMSLSELSFAEMHVKQAGWYRAQTADLGQWLVEQRNEWLAKAERARDTGDDDQRAVAEQEATDLAARVDSLSDEWPIRSLPAGGAQ